MTAYLCLALLVALSAFEGWLLHWLFIHEAAPRIKESLRRRDVVRQSSVDQQLRAMRAAQQISLLAWKARQELYNIEADECKSQER